MNSESPSPLVNVVDLEATCWDGPTPPGETNEVIEIGLCLFDPSGRQAPARHQIVVRPEHSSVSDFCTRLTGWTAEALEKGVSFQQACEQLERDFQSSARLMVSWGGYDDRQLRRQCDRLGLRAPLGPAETHHLDLKAAYQQFYQLRKRPGLASALDRAGLDFEGQAHRGVDDAWNVARLLQDMQRDGYRLPLTVQG